MTYASDITEVFGDTVITANAKLTGSVIGRTPVKNIAVAGAISTEGFLVLNRCDTQETIGVQIRADRVFESNTRLYVVSGGTVSELLFNELASGLRVTAKLVGNIADSPATRVHPGCVIQNLLGKYLLSIFPESGRCQQHQLPELEGWQILGAKHEHGVLLVMAEQSGVYRLWMFRFAGDKHDATKISDQFGDVNFCVTERGACVIAEPGGTLRVSMNSPGSTYINRTTNPLPNSLLFADGSKVLAADGRVLYQLSLT